MYFIETHANILPEHQIAPSNNQRNHKIVAIRIEYISKHKSDVFGAVRE